jgi:hypothetical protein
MFMAGVARRLSAAQGTMEKGLDVERKVPAIVKENALALKRTVNSTIQLNCHVLWREHACL